MKDRTEISQSRGPQAPGLQTGTGPWSVRNQAAQQEVSGRRVSQVASSASAATPQCWHRHLSSTSGRETSDSHRSTHPWCQEDWGLLPQVMHAHFKIWEMLSWKTSCHMGFKLCWCLDLKLLISPIPSSLEKPKIYVSTHS